MRPLAAGLAVLIAASCAGPSGAGASPSPTQAYGEIAVTLVRPTYDPNAPTPTVPVGTAVRIRGDTFDPQILRVPLGSTVTWTSLDAILHTVTAGTFGAPTGMFDRELLGGATFSYTFAQAGTFPYYCRLHGGMQATLVVR